MEKLAGEKVNSVMDEARQLNATLGVPVGADCAALLYDLRRAALAVNARREMKLAADEQVIADLTNLLRRSVHLASEFAGAADDQQYVITGAAWDLESAAAAITELDYDECAETLAALILTTKGDLMTEAELADHYETLATQETANPIYAGLACYYEPRLWMSPNAIVIGTL